MGPNSCYVSNLIHFIHYTYTSMVNKHEIILTAFVCFIFKFAHICLLLVLSFVIMLDFMLFKLIDFLVTISVSISFSEFCHFSSVLCHTCTGLLFVLLICLVFIHFYTHSQNGCLYCSYHISSHMLGTSLVGMMFCGICIFLCFVSSVGYCFICVFS